MSERRAFPHLVLAALTLTAASTTAVSAAGATQPRWSIQPTPNVTVQNNTLDHVSCASPKVCMAVGLANDQNGNSHALAQQWNGSAWSVVPTPSPRGSTLTGVSCTSPSACTAVGFTGNDRTLAERWDGTTWKIEPTPNPNSIIDHLTAVFCTGPSACTAVGWFITPSDGDDLTLVMHWNGNRWAVQPTPNPATAQTSVLQAVSCTSATACTAVGSTWPGKQGSAPTLVERWDGTSWSIQPTSVPPRQFNSNFLTGVSCAASTDCMAVGYSDDGNNGPSIPLAEHWNGAAWSVLPTPSPAGSVASKLEDVQCTSASACTAVGLSQSRKGAPPPLVEQWDGITWTIQPALNPPGAAASALFGVSCPTAGTCTAVGDSSAPIHGTSTLAERLKGTVWSLQSTPNATSLAPSELSGVACATSTSCAAVGAVFDVLPMAEHWDGAAWTVRFPPVPRFQGGHLVAVSCTATMACTAVGDSFDGNTAIFRTLVDRWDGSTWKVQSTPNPGGSPDSRLRSVSCTSASACTAAGLTVDGTTRSTHPLAERWDGVHWVIQSVPEPAGSRMAELDGVACASATGCTAVGTANGPGGTVTLAEGWNGTTWAIQPTPNPAGAKASVLSAVACAATTACTAVGHSSQGGTTMTLAERWNGTTWSIQPTPDPAGATSSILTGVACAGIATCTAVGQSSQGGTTMTLAERWNGTTWSIQPTPNPAGAESSILSSVSCTAAAACSAVGSYHLQGANDLTLAERFS